LQQQVDRLSVHQLLSDRDEVTGLYGRGFFQRCAWAEVERSRRFGGSVAVVVVQIQDLEPLREALGAAGFDDLLRWLAARLSETCRCYDVACRVDDEVVVLLPVTDGRGAKAVARRLANHMRLETPRSGAVDKAVAVSLRVGCAVADTSSTEPESARHDSQVADALLSSARQRLSVRCRTKVAPLTESVRPGPSRGRADS